MVMERFRRKQKWAENHHKGHPHYILGLDVERTADYTALVVMERTLTKAGAPYNATKVKVTRTRGALVEAIGKALDAVSAHDARGFFEHCGYRPRVQLL